jgi:WD40 repeat protein
VVPRLKKRSNEWVVIDVFRPRQQPIDEFSLALTNTFRLFGVERDWKSVRDLLRRAAGDADFRLIREIAFDLRAASGATDASILILLDQLEELFIQAEEPHASEFAEILRQACESDVSPFIVLTSLRSDFLPDFQAKSTWRHLPYETLPLTPLGVERYGELIERPAQLAAVDVEPELVQAVIADAGGNDALPLLAFALREMWERFGRHRRALTIDGYNNELGGMKGVIARVAKDALGQHGTGDSTWLRQAFSNLVCLDDSGHFTRKSVLSKTLPIQARPALERLTQARLLIAWGEGDERMVEVAHDALFHVWDELAAWLEADREFLLWHKRLQAATVEWTCANKDRSGVLRGGALAEAERWIDQREYALDATEKEFIEASLKRRRLRRAAVASGVLGSMLVAIFFFLLYRNAEEQRRRSDSGRLAASALLNINRQLDLALLLGLEAEKRAPMFEALNAILTGAQSNPRLVTFLHHPFPLADVAFSPNGKFLAVAGEDGVWSWDVLRRKPLAGPLQGLHGGAPTVTFSPDGNLLAAGGVDGMVRFWDVHTWQPYGEPLKGHAGTVYTLAFSGDGKTLASGGGDRTVRLWDVATRRLLWETLQLHTDPVSGVAFSPDGKTLASAGEAVRLWDVEHGRPFGKPLGDAANSVRFSPDGKTLASASARFNGTIGLWDVTSGQSVGKLDNGQKSDIYKMSFTADGRVLAGASSDGNVWLWDVAKQQLLEEPLAGHSNDVTGVAFSRDGILASAGADHTVRLWSHGVSLVEPLRVGPTYTPGTGSNIVGTVAFSPDGKRIASGLAGASVELWDIASRARLGIRLAGDEPAFSPDGKTLASATLDNDTIRLWDVSNGSSVGGPLQGHTSAIVSLAFSPDGKTLASASWDKTVRLWDVASHRSIGEPLQGHKDWVFSVAFSPDGRTLASASRDHTVMLWNTATHRLIGEPLVAGSDDIVCVTFSPDGRILASGGDKLILWDVVSRRPLGDPLLANDHVRSVAFRSDGMILASADADRKVQLWDVETRQPLGDAFLHGSAVNSVAFRADGKMLASGTDDGTVLLFDVDPRSWASRACERANRNLSLAEWQHYIGANVPYHLTCAALPPN